MTTPPTVYREHLRAVRMALRTLEVVDSAFRTVPGQVFLATLFVLLLLAGLTLRDTYVDSGFRELSESTAQTTASLVQARLQLAARDDLGPRLRGVVHQIQMDTANVVRVDLVDGAGLVRASSSMPLTRTEIDYVQLADARAAGITGASLALGAGNRLVVRRVPVSAGGSGPPVQESWLLLVIVDDVVTSTVRHHMLTSVQISTCVLLLAALGVALYIHMRLILPARRLGSHMHDLANPEAPPPLDIAHFPAELRPIAEGFNLGVDGLRAAREQVAWLDRDRFERLERLATIGRLSAMAAHEIRNPLAGIANAVAVIVREVPMSDEFKHILTEVQNQARRLSRTLTDLLTSTQPHQAQIMRVDGGTLIERTVAMVRPTFARCGHRLDAAISPECRALLVDEEWLVQVIINLLVNAEEALRDGGTVRVVLEPAAEDPAFVRLEVRDDGVGMTPEVLARAGEPFYTTRERGTGLGLSMSRDLITKMGGKLTIDSTLGLGTTVRLLLPVDCSPETRRA